MKDDHTRQHYSPKIILHEVNETASVKSPV